MNVDVVQQKSVNSTIKSVSLFMTFYFTFRNKGTIKRKHKIKPENSKIGKEQFPFFHMLKSLCLDILNPGPRAKSWLMLHLEGAES